MILNFMKSSALDLLKTDISNNVARYSSKDKWIDNYFEEKKFSSYSFSTGIAVPDVELIAGDAKTDYENAVNLYEAFRDRINPVQAGDLRLWAFLAHSVYWDYMRERWAIDMVSEDEGNDETVKNKMVSRIGVRYFFGASMAKAFVRHGIARLYWRPCGRLSPCRTPSEKWIRWRPGPTALSSGGGGCPWGWWPSSSRPGPMSPWTRRRCA